MIAKTERFELRLDSSTLERLDQWRTEQFDLPSRAEAVRRLIDLGFSDKEKKEFKLEDAQRLTVYLMTEMLKDPKDREINAKRIRLIQEAIFGGHYWAMRWEMPGIFHDDADNPDDVSFVGSVLDMWAFIEMAYSAFDEAEKEEVKKDCKLTGAPQFPGFDGNYETALMSIARFLVKELERFTVLKSRDFNSHVPMSARYREMLPKFEKMRATIMGRDLSVAEVIALLKRN